MKDFENLLSDCGFKKMSNACNNSRSLEEVIGLSLPVDYKYYLDNYETFEGFVGKEFLMLYNIDVLIALNSGRKNTADKIIIGSNGASETIGIMLDDKLVIAQYIDDIDDHIEIGESFTDAIQRLINGDDWFI